MPNTRVSTFVEHSLGSILLASKCYSGVVDSLTKVRFEPSVIIPALATDFSLPFCPVITANVVALETSLPVTVKYDGATGNAIPLTGGALMWTAVTGIYVTNANTSDVVMSVVLVGN